MSDFNIISYLDNLINQALKLGQKDMLSIYRMAKAEMVKYQKDNSVSETEIDYITVFKRMKKMLLEEIEGIKEAGRDTTIISQHLEWVVSMLPEEVSEEEIRADLTAWIAEQPDTNIGAVMQHLKQVFSGKTLDMGLASKIAKELLQK